MRRRSEKYITEGSNYAHWIGLYLSCHLNWVLGPFVHGRLQNLQTSEVTFAHFITPSNKEHRKNIVRALWGGTVDHPGNKPLLSDATRAKTR